MPLLAESGHSMPAELSGSRAGQVAQRDQTSTEADPMLRGDEGSFVDRAKPIPVGANGSLQTEHPLLAKLEALGALPQADRDLLGRMLHDVRSFDSRKDVIRQGDSPDHVHLMVEGWSCRYSILRNGKRQITAFLIPGDFCDAHITILKKMDHSIMTLGVAKVAFISKDLMREVADRPVLTRALWWASLVDEGVLRAWIVNVGRRSAFDRVAHLICELHARLQNVGIATGDSFKLPLTQEELADALSLTNVHINRVLRRLRERGLMTFDDRTIIIQNIESLKHVSGFDPS